MFLSLLANSALALARAHGPFGTRCDLQPPTLTSYSLITMKRLMLVRRFHILLRWSDLCWYGVFTFYYDEATYVGTAFSHFITMKRLTLLRRFHILLRWSDLRWYGVFTFYYDEATYVVTAFSHFITMKRLTLVRRFHILLRWSDLRM
jgi:hypothetical protein